MIDIINKFKHKVNLVAISYGIESDWEIVLVECDIPYYVIMCGLGVPLFSTHIHHEREAQYKLDILYDKIVLELYKIEMDVMEKRVSEDEYTVYYVYSHESKDSPRIHETSVKKEAFLKYCGEECGDCEHSWEYVCENALKGFIREQRKDNYLKNLCQ